MKEHHLEMILINDFQANQILKNVQWGPIVLVYILLF